MLKKIRSKTEIRNLQLKIEDFSNLICTTFRLKNKNIFTSPEANRINSTASNSDLDYPIISTTSRINKPKIQLNTQQNFFNKKNLKIIPTSGNIPNILQNSKKILFTLKKTMKKIKDKKREQFNEFLNQTFVFYDTSKDKLVKTVPKFKPNETKLLLPENSKNKNKFKELRFKIHNTIKQNTLPLCNNYITKAHLFNEKLLEYYRSENHINLLKNFKKGFKFNVNIENHPRIKMYTDIGDIEKESESKKVNFKKVFTPEEQKLIMLDTAYYFQRDNPNIFTNVNIIKKKNLADRIQDEEEEHQVKKILNDFLNKKNRNKLKNSKMDITYNDMLRGVSDSTVTKINKILSSKEMKNLSSKKIENLDLNDFSPDKTDDNAFSKISKNNKNFDFFNIYKLNLLESNKEAEKLRNIDKEHLDKENLFKFNIESRLKKCERKINLISKDKSLVKRAKENMYYDKTKDEKNEFNIETKAMAIEKNIEYNSKHRRKMRELSKINRKNILDNKKDGFEEDDNEENKKKKNNNILSKKKDKKLINYYINKIKVNYKQQ